MPLKYNPLLEENFQELNPAGAGGSDLQSTLLAGNITGGQSIVLSGSDAIKSTNSQLLLNGVYVWEGRNCFLSEAHTDEVIASLEEKIKLSCRQLAERGIIITAN